MGCLVVWCAPVREHGGGCLSSNFSLDDLGGNGPLRMPSSLMTRPICCRPESFTPSKPKPVVGMQFQVPALPPSRNCLVCQATTETLYHGQQSLEGKLPAGKLNLILEAARTEEKLRAAAVLRARSFYTYPEGRSIDALKMHQKMKADDEWATLTRKIGGLEPGYKRTTCLIASCHLSDWSSYARTDLYSSCQITSSSGEVHLVLGTLDINQGLVLPGELPGDHPQGPNAECSRAYVANVCVAQEVRRRGVGMVLIQHAKKTAKLFGVSDLYIHVVVDNISARKLYEKAGFLYEKEESVKDARSMARPRRFLLRAQL